MNQTIKAQWTAALRSGDYPQGTNALKRVGGGLCCLGVLCELAVKAGVIHELRVGAAGAVEYGNHSGSSQIALPFSVQQWAGLANENPNVNIEGGIDSLAALNDDGVDFAAIADLIDAQL